MPRASFRVSSRARAFFSMTAAHVLAIKRVCECVCVCACKPGSLVKASSLHPCQSRQQSRRKRTHAVLESPCTDVSNVYTHMHTFIRCIYIYTPKYYCERCALPASAQSSAYRNGQVLESLGQLMSCAEVVAQEIARQGQSDAWDQQ